MKKFFIKDLASMVEKEIATAVSYTHLDVYKRQLPFLFRQKQSI